MLQALQEMILSYYNEDGAEGALLQTKTTTSCRPINTARALKSSYFKQLLLWCKNVFAIAKNK